MTLTQVGKFMPEGLRALGSLINMLYEAVAGCRGTAKLSAGRESMDIILDGKYQISLNYAEPDKIWFGTRCRIDPEGVARLGVGELEEASWVPGCYRWWRSVELDSEEVHFFSRGKVSQMQWLENFLRDCLEKASSIETPDQPPVPEKPTGS